MYKMSYYRFGETRTSYNHPPGFDRTRGYVIGRKEITLDYIEEAYTTENWLVRIYKVFISYIAFLKCFSAQRFAKQACNQSKGQTNCRLEEGFWYKQER